VKKRRLTLEKARKKKGGTKAERKEPLIKERDPLEGRAISRVKRRLVGKKEKGQGKEGELSKDSFLTRKNKKEGHRREADSSRVNPRRGRAKKPEKTLPGPPAK